MKEDMTKNILIKNGQEHIANFLDKLNDEEREVIEKQVSKIDFKLIEKLYQGAFSKESKKENNIEPIDYIDKEKMSSEDKQRYIKIGEEKIHQGKLAAVTMAG